MLTFTNFTVNKKPTITPEDIDALCEQIRNYGRTKNIDGPLLANAVRFVYLTFIKKSELINLEIRNVVGKGGEILNEIKIGRGEIPLSQNAKDHIVKHLRYLKDKGYNTTRAQPLFPPTKRSFAVKYGGGTLWNHLNTCTNGNFPGFGVIGHLGVYHRCLDLNYPGEEGLQKIIKEATKFSGYSKKHIVDIMRGKVKF